MNFFFKKSKVDIALKYFRKPPGYYNCAQVVLKAFQEDYQISNDDISEFAKYGNGKAPNGLCGAYFAGLELLKSKPELIEEFTTRFQEKSDNLTCYDIRSKDSMSCKNLVRLAVRLLDELTTKQEK